ncbi:hypothetical protein KP79_PYT17542 [Mizuhopecten yessoensis]|uniref:L-Fucosyltransferase n=1 Tax=Mizuhopecten yessoensis TaxID=6573 RepID=A0A210QL76_MIZYE|nr:hypothetical protein KP79_PYT17542 [Mizuhopecten yessoensis]
MIKNRLKYGLCFVLVLCPVLYILQWQIANITRVNDVSVPRKLRKAADSASLTSNHNLLLNSIPKTYTSGYIVYKCTNTKQSACGGWSDRLSGILSTFVISLLTKQRFLIHHDQPYLLQDYLAPNEYDWRYNSSILTKLKRTNHNLDNANSVKIKKYLYGKKDLNNYFKRNKIHFIRMNWDFTEVFRTRSHIGRDVPWITKLHYADIYKELFNYLFKPSETLSRALKAQKRPRSKTACAHIRIGRNPTVPNDPPRHQQPMDILWNFFDRLDKDLYNIFVATDDDRILKTARDRYPEDIIDTYGKIGHIAKLPEEQKGNKDIFVKMFLDFSMLINCDILILTESGFGMVAAYIRNTDADLYCWRGPELRPGSRYTVHHMFKWPLLAPSNAFPIGSRV